MTFKPKDHYFHKAKEEGFLARSVYKLQEIDQKLKIIKPGLTVVDLGAAPGSWSQWVASKVGSKGQVVGFDLTAIDLKLPNAKFYQQDVLEINLPEFLKAEGVVTPVDLVISDMAPKTTGIRLTDQARSMELCNMALDIAEQILKPRGHFVVKFFQSNDFNDYRARMKKLFEKVEIVKPDSTRSRSFEIFIVGLNKK